MLRPKRQHTSYHNVYADDHSGPPNDDELLRMNPSLMTERQQLAFLLRKTAHDASGGSSDSNRESSSDDEDHHAMAVKAARRIPSSSSKSSPRSQQIGDVVIYCGRGRPPKNSIKLPPGQSSDEYKKLLLSPLARKPQVADGPVDPHAPNRKKLKVRTSTTTSAAASAHDGLAADTKISPSSSSDVLRMDAFESSGGAATTATATSGGDFWRQHCALCCDKTRAAALDAFGSDALFLCPSCDQKYPTQRALGRV